MHARLQIKRRVINELKKVLKEFIGSRDLVLFKLTKQILNYLTIRK
jgi:hypothetical protein